MEFEFDDNAFEEIARDAVKEPERKLNETIARVQRDHGTKPVAEIVTILDREVRQSVPEIRFPLSDISTWAQDIHEAATE